MKPYLLLQYINPKERSEMIYGYFDENGVYQESEHGLAIIVRARLEAIKGQPQ